MGSDAHEQEAQHVSSQVMAMPDLRYRSLLNRLPGIMAPLRFRGRVPNVITHSRNRPWMRRNTDSGQRDGERLCNFGPRDRFNSTLAGLRAAEVPLPSQAKTFFEPRFGRDFSNVRVHTGIEAAESARDLKANSGFYVRQRHCICPGPVFACARFRPHPLEPGPAVAGSAVAAD